MNRRTTATTWAAVVAVAALRWSPPARGGDDDDADDAGASDPDTSDIGDADPGDCIVVDMAVSSEKIALLTDLADEFNRSDAAEVDGRCIFVRPRSVASGLAATLIPAGLARPRRPTASRRSSGRRRRRRGPASSTSGPAQELAPAGTPFMLTPLVIAMPKPMAEALGWPDTPDRLRRPRCRWPTTPAGWGSVGHPEWGPFRLGKTNPNFSTSGLNFTIAEYYAADGKTPGLTIEDLARPGRRRVRQQDRVVRRPLRRHHDDVPQQLVRRRRARHRADVRQRRGRRGEERHRLQPRQPRRRAVARRGAARPPRPLVAIYPKEGTLYSDSPFIVLDTDWVDDDEKAAAGAVRGLRAAAGEPAAGAGVRVPPEQPDRPAGRPDRRRQRRRPDPADGRARGARRRRCSSASSTRGPSCARTPGCCSCSTSRARWASRPATARPASTSPSRRRSAPSTSSRTPTTSGCGCSAPTSAAPTRTSASSCRSAPIGEQQDGSPTPIAAQFPTNGTPLYEVTEKAYDDDARRRTTRRRSTPSCCSPTARTTTATPATTTSSSPTSSSRCRPAARAQSSQPVRLFTISYGETADVLTLRAISQATQRGDVQRQQPGDHQPGVHRRDQQLLASR